MYDVSELINTGENDLSKTNRNTLQRPKIIKQLEKIEDTFRIHGDG